MIAEPRINRSEFEITLISDIMNFTRNFFLLKSTMWCKGASHLHHNFAMPALNNKIRIDFWQKSIQNSTTNLSVIDRSLFFRDASFSLLLVISCFSFLFNPIHQSLISIGNLDISMIIEKIMSSFGSKKTNEKATFSIYNAGKISEFCFSHITPLVNDYTVYNRFDYLYSLND